MLLLLHFFLTVVTGATGVGGVSVGGVIVGGVMKTRKMVSRFWLPQFMPPLLEEYVRWGHSVLGVCEETARLLGSVAVGLVTDSA